MSLYEYIFFCAKCTHQVALHLPGCFEQEFDMYISEDLLKGRGSTEELKGMRLGVT